MNLQPKPVRLSGCSSHGDWMDEGTLTFPRQADPPSSGGVGHSAGDAAISRGSDGFSLPEGTDLWALVVGDDASIASGVAAGLEQLKDQPGRLASARLKALAELQAVLRTHGNGIDWNDPISVPAGDLVLVVQLALQRLG